MHFAFTNIRALNDGLQIKAIICNLIIIIVVFDVILKFTKNSRWTPSLRDYLHYWRCVIIIVILLIVYLHSAQYFMIFSTLHLYN